MIRLLFHFSHSKSGHDGIVGMVVRETPSSLGLIFHWEESPFPRGKVLMPAEFGGSSTEKRAS